MQRQETAGGGEMEAMQRRVLHFSDGTMEESAIHDEKDVPDKAVKESTFKYAANKILAGIDYMGGGLAEFLGISTPKYASEIEYCKREAKSAETDNGNDIWLRSYEKTSDETCNRAANE